MPQTIAINVAALIVDNENPRIPDEGLRQREAMRAVAGEEDGKLLLALAEDVVNQGQLDPSQSLIVFPSIGHPNQFVVGEGNRRLTAIKALENPDTFTEAVSSVILDRIRKLSAKYQSNPITEIQCCVMKDAQEAHHWIELRHTGPNGGAGLVPWGPHQKARFDFRTTGRVKMHVALLDFLESRGHLSTTERRQVPLSSFERLVKSPDVRKRIGVNMDKDGKLHFVNEDIAVKGLLHIARDLLSGTTRVGDIYHAPQRTAYANRIPVQAVPLPVPASAIAAAAPAAPALSPSAQRTPLLRLKKERDRLVPSECRLRITEPRIRRIGQELQSLLLKDHPNAIAGLFRVFVELSTDYYLVNSMGHPKSYLNQKDATLSMKLLEVATHFETHGMLSRQDVAPVKAACAKASFLATSVITMHEYLHNFLMNPTPVDLRAAWDGLEPFLKAIWP